MSRASDHYYLTTPIYYVNAVPHIGHAYTSVAADIMARYQRLLDKDVHFLTGTDEHGQKIARAAAAAGRTPGAHVDSLLAAFQALTPALNLSNTDFIRTTETRHLSGAQKFWEAAVAAGDIYKKSYTGWYCVECEQFYLAKDLLEQRCPIHGKTVEEVAEENYFFRLSRYTAQLKKHFAAHPNFVLPLSRGKEMQQILAEGLVDVSVSRSVDKLSWGVPVPGDPSHVMYVWFDALTNYVTAVGYGEDEVRLDKWWPANAHVMAKEIARFHALLWPAMLLSAGLALPEQIVVHGWLTVAGKKMSKSLGNVVAPLALVEKYGADVVRFYFFREIPFGQDGDFSVAKLLERYQADLQHDLGNLLSRSVSMALKFTDGVVPDVTPNDYQEQWERYRTHMDNWEFQAALGVVWDYVRAMNQLVDQKKPWELHKQGKIEELAETIYTLLEGLRTVAVALQPFMPATAEKIWTALGYEYYQLNWSSLDWGLLKSGTPLSPPPQLFPPLD